MGLGHEYGPYCENWKGANNSPSTGFSLSLKNFPSPLEYDGDDDAQVVRQAPICGGEAISNCKFRFFYPQDLSLCLITIPAPPFLSE